MTSITGLDHVAITVADLDASCAFYRALFSGRDVAAFEVMGKVAMRQIAVGGAAVSIHQAGSGFRLVAKHPTRGADRTSNHRRSPKPFGLLPRS